MTTKSSMTLALAAFFLGGCHAAIVGNLLVLGITVGIFVATLSLGRVAAKTGATASQSADASNSSRG